MNRSNDGSLHCDNYATCNSIVMSRGSLEATYEVARAKGWHIYHGPTMGGKMVVVWLCGRCVDDKRRKLSPAPPHLRGQLELFEILVTVRDDG